nr:zinc finger, CCHC-type [Tanacetum cinerariifolium]
MGKTSGFDRLRHPRTWKPLVAKGLKYEVFGMPIPDALITNNIRSEPAVPESSVPKAAKATKLKAAKQSRQTVPKAAKPTIHKATTPSKPTSQPPKPKLVPTKPSKAVPEKKQKLVKETPDEPSPAKRCKPNSPLRLVDEFADEDKGKEKIIDEQVAYILLDLNTLKKKSVADQYILQRRTSETAKPTRPELTQINNRVQDEGQDGSNPGKQDEGQARSNPGNAIEFQPQPSHVVHAGPKLKPMDLEENLKLPTEYQVILEEPASSTRTLSSLQNLDKELNFTDQFFVEKPQEEELEKTNAYSKVQLMVTVPIHQDTYMAKDASSKKFLVSNFTNYKMTDSRPVLEQYNELFDFKHTLKHLKEELTLVKLSIHLGIEESLMAHDNDKPEGNNVTGPLVVNMVDHNNSSKYNYNKVWETWKLEKDCKAGNISNKANGSGTKGSVDGSSNSLKGNESKTMVHGSGCVDLRDTIFDENKFSLVLRPSQRSLVKGTEDFGGTLVPEKVTEEGFIMPGNENKACKLIKSLYGLKHAPNKFDESSKRVIICQYVDDMLIFGTDQVQIDLTKEFLSSRFSMKDMGEADVILVSTPMDTSEKMMPNNGQDVSQLEYSRVIGCLMYAMTCRRSDIAFVMGKLSRCTSNPGFQEANLYHWFNNGILICGFSNCRAATLAKTYSQMYNEKSRHLGVKHSMIRELITNGVVSIEFVRSQQNLADHLTKGLARDLVIKSVAGMRLKSN